MALVNLTYTVHVHEMERAFREIGAGIFIGNYENLAICF
jgi:hypothetical protein